MKQISIIVKHVKLKDLHDCYMKQQLIVLAPSEESEVILVAKEGQIGDWAAYSGWPIPCLRSRGEAAYYSELFSTFEGVLSNGDKMDEDDARKIFPEFKDFTYRR
jgi:hypothetical protein